MAKVRFFLAHVGLLGCLFRVSCSLSWVRGQHHFFGSLFVSFVYDDRLVFTKKVHYVTDPLAVKTPVRHNTEEVT